MVDKNMSKIRARYLSEEIKRLKNLHNYYVECSSDLQYMIKKNIDELTNSNALQLAVPVLSKYKDKQSRHINIPLWFAKEGDLIVITKVKNT